MQIKTNGNTIGTPQSLTDLQENTREVIELKIRTIDNTASINKLESQQRTQNRILSSFLLIFGIMMLIGLILLIWALKVHLPTDILRAMAGKLCY